MQCNILLRCPVHKCIAGHCNCDCANKKFTAEEVLAALGLEGEAEKQEEQVEMIDAACYCTYWWQCKHICPPGCDARVCQEAHSWCTYNDVRHLPQAIAMKGDVIDIIFLSENGSLDHATLKCTPDTDEGYAYDITLDYEAANSSSGGNRILARPKYNSTLTFLRLGIDGNVKLYTYNDKVDWGAWEVTFALFDRDNSIWETECQLPERCGNFGLCEDSQCVACPSSKGLLGWSKTCEPEKLTSCNPKSFRYYKVEGVDHFLSKYTRGDATKEADCGKKCTSDCKCLGYFYNQDTSRCWIAYDLKTLTKVANSTHVAYIKTPN
ncbi:hypothetical protein GBA52_013706 [Prunus armeniaca]|nr:hypothetical protein GBA52_013706 [Prunus armeniaca]